MEKLVLEKLHLCGDDFTKEKYLNLSEKLLKLETPLLKKFYAVYIEINKLIEKHILDNEGINFNIQETRDKDHKDLREDDKIKKFLSGRIEDNYIDYLDEIWRNNLLLINDELNKFNSYQLIEFNIRSHSLAHIIETMIVKSDEYWLPKSDYTLFLLKYSGFSFEKEKERVWQPKTS